MEKNQEFDSQEFDEEFHSVDPDSLKVTVDEILSGGGLEAEEMDYTVAVPTANHPRIPRLRGFSSQLKLSVFDDTTRSQFAEKRGTLGGC
ncbi:hypothetical protein IQ269_11205 [Tychonema sp. LEGE 07199]|uniref:hypothetical protein n=1 Tax=Microcoleaceae TaxID=1892252 RepID=UPI00187F22F3|nr:MULTISPECIES: hypothetical protein [unclassified Tychonema]MBE9121349.1 hypothetical protein [Tychonema sp. LEGE 07199]MBE9134210.1 hypothetical protein [Tychonema sp. LEGE 07196]